MAGEAALPAMRILLEELQLANEAFGKFCAVNAPPLASYGLLQDGDGRDAERAVLLHLYSVFSIFSPSERT